MRASTSSTNCVKEHFEKIFILPHETKYTQSACFWRNNISIYPRSPHFCPCTHRAAPQPLRKVCCVARFIFNKTLSRITIKHFSKPITLTRTRSTAYRCCSGRCALRYSCLLFPGVSSRLAFPSPMESLPKRCAGDATPAAGSRHRVLSLSNDPPPQRPACRLF